MSKNISHKPVCQAGKYRHYKGNEYEVIDLVRHSETEEWLVLYRPQYGDAGLWVRPYKMFFEKVTLAGGQVVDRFARL
ncbi:DUF1653 domain-containing protein [Neptunomonas qingdaonensis]|uniref:DUF1653 domain-containing protein n=1 Tax=Neptunomonas qingdaonensis TaxID=1045558 RepID=A0A1I2PFQ6_9GAMM|nr:DUF1653 domain-containing protein [Neptunomonas qingdaonensis]SFG12251.1 Protein of unknown function [Neptunomonas qingdaonensis]